MVAAAIRIANCFLHTVQGQTTASSVGVSAKELDNHKIKILFADPYKYEPFEDDENKYAYSWIDPKTYDGYTVIVDSHILKRYTVVCTRTDPKSVSEGEKIEFFVGIKIGCHETVHLGFRWKRPEHLLPPYDHTPDDVFGGESGRYAERIIMGGELGLIHKSPKVWNGTQEVVGIHVDSARILDSYIAHVCSECRRDRPNYVSLLPVAHGARPFCAPRGTHVLSAPPHLPPAEESFDLDEPQPCEDDCFMMHGGLCCVHLLPRPIALDFEAAGGGEPWARRLRPRRNGSCDGLARAAGSPPLKPAARCRVLASSSK